MFEKDKLAKAIAANDLQTITKIVNAKGPGILAKRLGVLSKRDAYQPGDEYLGRIFRKPAALAFALLVAEQKTIDHLQELGASPTDKVDSNYPNMLFAAAALGRKQALENWLDDYREAAQVRNADNDSLLHVACLHGQWRITELLLARGFYTRDKSDSGRTPLAYAEEANDRHSIRMLHQAEEATQVRAPVAPRLLPAAPETIKQKIDQTPVTSDVWHVIDADRVARVTNVPEIGYRLTEIFNFASGEVMRLNRNLESGAETAIVSSFADFQQAGVLGDAAARLGLRVDTAKLLSSGQSARGLIHKKPQ